jgi:hypothetical protein
VATHHASRVEFARRRYGWRLKILLGLTTFLLGVYVLSRLSLPQAKLLGPWGESVYEVFNPPAVPDLSPSGRRLVVEVKELAGEAQRLGHTPGFLGLFGGTDTFSVRLNGTKFGDEDLARLLEKHGHSIWSLDLRNTNVTDQGLRHLKGMSNLEHLVLGNDDLRHFKEIHWPTSPITDAGLVHIRELPELTSLHLSGLPITDAGLAAIGDLPNLGSLYLSRTNVQGPGLGQLKSLPKLVLLYLDGSDVSDSGLSHLAGASNLQYLSLNGLPLTAGGLKHIKPLPRLGQLDITGCGLLDEEVQQLKSSNPGLKIERR